jgi:hypothetical protein
MATGPEHYRDAERAIENAKYEDGGSHKERFFLDVALIHTTLASAAATAMGLGELMNPIDLEAWDAVCGTQEDGEDPFETAADEMAGVEIDAAVESTGHLPGHHDANPLRHTPLAGAFGVDAEALDALGEADLGPEQQPAQVVVPAAEESSEDREVAYRKRLAATSYPVTVHYGPYIREQIDGDACGVCFYDFKRGEETVRYDARDSDAELYRHLTCQPLTATESEA